MRAFAITVDGCGMRVALTARDNQTETDAEREFIARMRALGVDYSQCEVIAREVEPLASSSDESATKEQTP